MSDPIETKVKQIVAAQLAVDIAKVVPDATFIEDLKVDELQERELVLAYEEGFEIEISDEDSPRSRSRARRRSSRHRLEPRSREEHGVA